MTLVLQSRLTPHVVVLSSLTHKGNFSIVLPRKSKFYQPTSTQLYLMDSRLPISEANEVLHVDLPTKEFQTVGSMVMARLRRIPAEGDSVVESGYRFTVDKATARSTLKLRAARDGIGWALYRIYVIIPNTCAPKGSDWPGEHVYFEVPIRYFQFTNCGHCLVIGVA
ncbi:MAG: transporter associated domain-containing protein [Pseudomonadota bacterium]